MKYTIDQGPWTSAVPADGTFDTAVEDFAFDLTDPPIGTHIIHVLAADNLGKNTTTSFTVQLPVGTPDFAKWGAKPADHRFDLAQGSSEPFQADIKVNGTLAYVYVQYRITSDTGSTYTVLSQVTRLAAASETIIPSIWIPPPVQSPYHSSATIYYSPWAALPNTTGWTIGQSREFTFQVTM